MLDPLTRQLVPAAIYHAFSSFATLDSGATSHFAKTANLPNLKTFNTDLAPLPILSPSGNAMPVSAKGQLQFSTSLSTPAQMAHVLEELKTGSFIS